MYNKVPGINCVVYTCGVRYREWGVDVCQRGDIITVTMNHGYREGELMCARGVILSQWQWTMVIEKGSWCVPEGYYYHSDNELWLSRRGVAVCQSEPWLSRRGVAVCQRGTIITVTMNHGYREGELLCARGTIITVTMNLICICFKWKNREHNAVILRSDVARRSGEFDQDPTS